MARNKVKRFLDPLWTDPNLPFYFYILVEQASENI